MPSLNSTFSQVLNNEDYLDDEHLIRLKDYKYNSVDLSPTTKYVLRHWWNWVAELMPPWLAPNMITLLGLGFILFNVMTIIVFIPDLEGPASSWMYFSFAIGLFIYQTLDNVDGKQARKTGTSSPLGELFDHGIDSLNCVLGGIVQCATVGLGHSPYSAVLMVIACWPMYLSTWEEYHTGVLYLGVINGPTEGLLIAMGVHLVSAIWGPHIWSVNARALLPGFLNPVVPVEAKLVNVYLWFVFGALVMGHAPFCLINVYNALSARRRDPMAKKANVWFIDAVTELAPMFAFTGLALTWVVSPYSCLLKEEKFIEFSFMLGFMFGRMSTKIILAHLTQGGFPWFSMMIVPLAGGSFLINLPFFGLPHLMSPFGEVVYLRLALLYSAIAYSHASLHVIERFCGFLGINCLTIPYGPRNTVFAGDSKDRIY